MRIFLSPIKSYRFLFSSSDITQIERKLNFKVHSRYVCVYVGYNGATTTPTHTHTHNYYMYSIELMLCGKHTHINIYIYIYMKKLWSDPMIYLKWHAKLVYVYVVYARFYDMCLSECVCVVYTCVYWTNYYKLSICINLTTLHKQ